MATLTHAAFTRMGESTVEDWAATIPALWVPETRPWSLTCRDAGRC